MLSAYPFIGKTLLGCRNEKDRVGHCQWCGQRQELDSFDTNAWLIVAYIPVWKLGRRRIIDLCPLCGFHIIAHWDYWEMARQMDITGARHMFRSLPSPETSVELHEQYLRFHHNREAVQLENSMEGEFAKNARVQAYLGDVRMDQGKEDNALLYYQRALKLRPDLPEARIALAFDSIRNERLSEARKHLSFLEEPGAAQLYPMEPLNALANAFVRAKRAEEALQIYAKLLEAYPEAGQDKKLRAYIRKVEKDAKIRDTILPRRKFFVRAKNRSVEGSTRRIVARILAFVLFVSLVYVLDQRSRAHRSLHIVNSGEAPLEVSVNGGKPLLVEPGVETANIGEGHNDIAVTGPGGRTIHADLAGGGFLGGILKSPAWILDAGKLALFVRETKTYEGDTGKVTREDFLHGQDIYPVPDVDLLFEPFPEKRGSSKLTRFALFDGTGMSAVVDLINAKREADAINLAEWFLIRQPLDMELFRFYGTRYVPAPGYAERARQFLRSCLARRPLELEWHRSYQDILLRKGERAALAAEYDGFLQEEPDHASLLYLRSRAAESPTEALGFLSRALEKNETDTYAGYALAYQEMVQGNFTSAAERFRKIAELEPNNQAFFDGWMLAERGAARAASAEEQSRLRLGNRKADTGTSLALIDSLLDQTKHTEAEQALADFAGDQAKVARLLFLYQTGRAGELDALVKNDATSRGREYQFALLAEQGKVELAEKLVSNDPFQHLALSLAWILANNKKNAEVWRLKAVEAFKRDPDPDMRRAMALLESQAPPDRSQLDAIVVSLKNKALLCGWLAARYPKNSELAELARALNVDHSPPSRLIAKALTPPAKTRER